MPELTRRKLLRTTSVVGLSSYITENVGDEIRKEGIETDHSNLDEEVTVEKVVGVFSSPIGLEFAKNRLFVADQTGQIYSYNSSNSNKSLFLDISDRITDISGYSERGLLGLAFHPNFDANNKFYVRYSSPPLGGTPDDYSHTEVLSEFEAKKTENADPNSERILMKIPQPQSNHNAGSIVFGPDGYLYVAVGDGGGAGDKGKGHVDDWYDANSGGNGQDVEMNLLGSILRIDVDNTQDGKEYAIPDDNPLVGNQGLDEHYAWGLRNPWRMSFTDGDLYAADVGQNAYEEIDIIEKGANYGWNVKEASHCYNSDTCPDEAPGGNKLIDPIVEYPHSRDGEQIGSAVIGGYLYKGSIPLIQGKYVFGDWSGSFSGNKNLLFTAEPQNGMWDMKRTQLTAGEDLGSYLLAFGRDSSGELYMATTDSATVGGNSGKVHKLVSKKPLLEAIANTKTEDGKINFDEVQIAINYWVNDEVVPGTGEKMDFGTLQKVIEYWIQDKKV